MKEEENAVDTEAKRAARLDQRVEQLSERLRKLGVGQEEMVKLLGQLRARAEASSPLRRALEDSSVADDMARVVTGAPSPVELKSEVFLDEEIRPLPGASFVQGEPESIFLTGATGFLGPFLLHELLRESRATLYCLTRADSVEAAFQRLQRGLAAFGLWEDAFTRRLVPVPGELARPLLGLTASRFEELAHRVDTIFHNGALVNFAYPYGVMKRANVLGTHEVLRLASRARTKPVHFTSTLSVFSDREHSWGHRILEREQPADEQRLTLGYAQSKWVAEAMLVLARERGLPISIYRPGRVSGHSHTGACQSQDFLWQVIKVSLLVGLLPEQDWSLELTPVDYVSRAMVLLSREPGSLGKNFHLVNPHPSHLGEVYDALVRMGYTLRRCPLGEWHAALTALAGRAEGAEWRPLVSVLMESRPPEQVGAGGGRYDCRETLAGLAGSSLECPRVDEALLRTYIEYFVRGGFPPPPAQAELHTP